ncbi:MAG: DUF503 domain-containing protein [Armatimonadetes bacterium]|nr:DUF503 domain-containing protein [Armatimonadota bacterium]
MAFAGILNITIEVSASESLKDKRHVVKSILDTTRNKFNVSAAEVAHLDSRKIAGLAFASVANDGVFVNKVLNKVLHHIEANPLCEVVDTSMEMV